MEGKLVLNLDKVRQGIAVNEGELLHKTQMKLLLAKIKQIMSAVSDFRRQFEGGQRPSAISHRRHHDAILLSGARGTGKTTFLLSALHELQAEQVDGKYAFCVFEPVDPTLFGCNEHILLTLLSMIAEKVRRGRDYSETSGYGHTGSSADWENWERQLKELAKGLRTVGEQREDIGSEPSARKDVWDDAEYLLEQGMDSARSSYELEYKLHGFINASLRLLNKDAFVLGLDDVDTRPGIGWHVLEVLRRYLTTPQLIVIVSGNMELFQKLVERQQLKNFGLDFSSSKDVLQNFAPQVTELTNQYLLKVLRTPMRIELLPFAEALERAVLAERNVSGKLNSDIDAHCIIRLDGKEVSLASALDNFYTALGCGADPNLKAVFRKALLTNSARTVLQVVEQLIELQNTSQTGDGAEQSRRVADILRIAFFDYLMVSGVAQPQEYFERLREGTGIEEITRLLLTDRLPGDVSLRPVHGDLRVDNSLLAFTSGLAAATADNTGIFFIYFFKVCFALQALDGQNTDIATILGETSLKALAFRCSSLIYGDARRPGWRAPGILALYGASIKKNAPGRVRKIYGDDFVDLLKARTPSQLLAGQGELLPFIETICGDDKLPQKGGKTLLRDYVITTPDSLQENIKSWHRAFVPHGFYEIAEQGGNYTFFSIWGLLGLMGEMLACTTEEDLFNVFFRNTRIMPLAYHGDTSPYSSGTTLDDSDNGEEADGPFGGEGDISADMENVDDSQFEERQQATISIEQKAFLQWIMHWKDAYSSQKIVCFLPPLLCERAFTRFLQGMERLNSVSSSAVFLGSYIHKAIVILFNSLLVEEYLAANNAEGLNLTTPLASNSIFLQNLRKVSEKEGLETRLDPSKLPPEKYPLTRLVMACPLWRFYLKPDEKESESIDTMLAFFWSEYDTQINSVEYIEDNYKFNNLYYIYNMIALRRNIVLDHDFRTDLGKEKNISKNPKKLMANILLAALKKAFMEKAVNSERDLELDEGAEDIAKAAFNLLYIPCPSTDRLWNTATANSRQTFSKGLEEIFGKPKVSRS